MSWERNASVFHRFVSSFGIFTGTGDDGGDKNEREKAQEDKKDEEAAANPGVNGNAFRDGLVLNDQTNPAASFRDGLVKATKRAIAPNIVDFGERGTPGSFLDNVAGFGKSVFNRLIDTAEFALSHFGPNAIAIQAGFVQMNSPGRFAIADNQLAGAAIGDAASLILGGFSKSLASGGSSFMRGLLSRGDGVSNPVPSTLARVVSGNRTLTTLGRPGIKDVFVTAADDIAGLNAAQLSRRLTIEPSDAFTVIKFPTPNSGLATPVNRLDKGFIGGGRTEGGAREFVLPNKSIPPGSTIEIIK